MAKLPALNMPLASNPSSRVLHLLTFETHWPSRLTRAGDHAPVAKTTKSAGHSVPSMVRTPTHVLSSAASIKDSKVPDVPHALLTPRRLSSAPTAVNASRAATHPASLTHRPRQP